MAATIPTSRSSDVQGDEDAHWIIGAGQVAQAFARKAIDAGHHIVFSNSRGRTAWRHWSPGARVVKALNASFMANFAKPPIVGGMRRVAFVSGDDRAAKATVADLLESFGFAPVDLGVLHEGGRIQGVGAPIAGHDFFLAWPAPRSFPAFNGEQGAR